MDQPQTQPQQTNQQPEQQNAQTKPEEKKRSFADWDLEKLSHIYPIIQEVTFRTEFLDVEMDEAMNMIRYFSAFRNGKARINPEVVKSIRGFEKKVEEFVEKHFKGKPFFIKFDMRSPKDGMQYNKMNLDEMYNRFYDYYSKQWSNYKGDLTPDQIKENIAFNAKNMIEVSLLGCHSAKDAVNLLLTAPHIFAYLIDLLKASNQRDGNNKKWELKLGFREYNPNHSLNREMRCLIKNGKMFGITQFAVKGLVYEFLDEELSLKIKAEVFKLWTEKLKDKLSFMNDYTFDVSFDDNFQFYVIEINPFEGANKRLFTDDLEALEGKHAPNGTLEEVDFRRNKAYTEEAKINVEEFMKIIKGRIESEKNYDEFLETALKEYYENQKKEEEEKQKKLIEEERKRIQQAVEQDKISSQVATQVSEK